MVSGSSSSVIRTLLNSTEISLTTRLVFQRSPIISSNDARVFWALQKAFWSIGGKSEWFMFMITRSMS